MVELLHPHKIPFGTIARTSGFTRPAVAVYERFTELGCVIVIVGEVPVISGDIIG